VKIGRYDLTHRYQYAQAKHKMQAKASKKWCKAGINEIQANAIKMISNVFY
tara:strand:- start:6713 stop:6865 length:153 start_codon:yes stop_codon:yes gene_type:complete